MFPIVHIICCKIMVIIRKRIQDKLFAGANLMKNNLADIRGELQLSLRALAGRSGVSWSHIAKIESGERNPTVPVAYAICKALNRTIYDVFPDR